ncbi:hypothetical protein KY284_020921 [Solanum tuberosum]|nr:hypothetical protein KY284_020921 [Solanum tuberosum]
MEPQGLLNDSSDLLVRNWKGAALKQMLQSLESDGGLTGCIQEALTSHSEASCAVEAKESGKRCEDGNRGSLPCHILYLMESRMEQKQCLMDQWMSQKVKQ